MNGLCFTLSKYAIFNTVAIIQTSLNMLVHGFGFYLLKCLHKTGQQTIHSILTMQLSIIECLINLFSALTLAIIRSVYQEPLRYRLIINYTLSSFDKLLFNGLSIIWGLIMLYITINRLVGSTWPLKSRVYLTKGNLEYLLAASWVVCFGVCLMCFVCNFTLFINFNQSHKAYTYALSVALGLKFLFTIATYICIFKMIVQSKRNITRCGSRKQKISLFQLYRKSRFYTTGFLLLTYLLFMIIPFIVWNYYIVMGNLSELEFYIFMCLVLLNFSFDAFIYIYVDEEVRKLMWKKLHWFK